MKCAEKLKVKNDKKKQKHFIVTIIIIGVLIHKIVVVVVVAFAVSRNQESIKIDQRYYL